MKDQFDTARTAPPTAFDRILPGCVCSAESYGDDDVLELPAVEAATISAAVPARRREFATGRACARLALVSLGHPPVSIGRGERGDPLWPRGTIGSITHCDGYRAAAVAPAGTLRTLGIDAEPRLGLPDGLLGSIALRAEVNQVGVLTERNAETPWDRLLFSAKESVYKAYYPLHRRTRGFKQVVVLLHPFTHTFVGWVTEPEADSSLCLAGRWTLTDEYILTAVAPVDP